MTIEDRIYHPRPDFNKLNIIEYNSNRKIKKIIKKPIDQYNMFTNENEFWEKFMLPERDNRKIYGNQGKIKAKKYHNISELVNLNLVELKNRNPIIKFKGK